MVVSTDGGGTKDAIARLVGRYDTIGHDVVAMSVDDIAVQGAEPLAFLDYLSVGKVVPETVEEIVSGVAEGCRQAAAALSGGVERAEILPRDVTAGDRIVGLASPGLRCNGYSLARRALLDRRGRSIEEPAWVGASRSLGAELLTPSVIYAPMMA